MEINKIIEKLIERKVINGVVTDIKQLSGGTSSQVFLINIDNYNKFVIKINEIEVIKQEAKFLEFYKNVHILPRLLYVDELYHYIVYSFIKGDTNVRTINKKETLIAIVKSLINQYQCVNDMNGWGWLDELSESWLDFLLKRHKETSEILETYLPREDIDLVEGLIRNIDSTNIKSYFIHGDCGYHNYIFDNDNLCGVIDPTSMIGEPIYDLMYAFCSTPNDLTKETLDLIVDNLVFEYYNNQQLYEQVIIHLYYRLATCVKFHIEDLDDYLKVWDYWKQLINVDKKS